MTVHKNLLLLCYMFVWIAMPLTISSARAAHPLYRVSTNPSFADGLDAWIYRDLNHRFLPRPYHVLDGTGRPDRDTNMLELTGTGGFGQFVQMQPGAEYQLLRCYGYKQSVDPTQQAGFAVAAVSYYDITWTEVAHYQTPLTDGTTDINQAYNTYGTYAPPTAAYAFLFIWIGDEGTKVVMDDLELLEVLPDPRFFQSGNLVMNATMNFTQVTGPQPYDIHTISGLTGPEFWEHSRDTQVEVSPFLTGRFRFFGSYNTEEWARQRVELTPGVSYQLEFFGLRRRDRRLTDFTLGVDFFDENGSYLSSQNISLASPEPNPDLFSSSEFTASRTIVPPANSRYEYVRVYAPASDGQLQVESIVLRQ